MTRMRVPHDALQERLRSMACRHCGAEPNTYCRRPNGDVAPWQHSARYAALRDLEKAARR